MADPIPFKGGTGNGSNDNAKPRRLQSEWRLHGATVVSISDQGRLLRESDLEIVIIEGRVPSWHPIDGDVSDLREVWEYGLHFYELGANSPTEATFYEGYICIVGTTDDGGPCKIYGRGYASKSGTGEVEGSFDRPPRIEIIEADEDMLELDDW
jgi:hypothetical protein